MPYEFPILTQDGNLRRVFVQVDAHVYHRLGLLSQSGLATFSEVPAYFRLDGRPTCLWHHYGLAGGVFRGDADDLIRVNRRHVDLWKAASCDAASSPRSSFRVGRAPVSGESSAGVGS
jgi:hypothetical protein